MVHCHRQSSSQGCDGLHPLPIGPTYVSLSRVQPRRVNRSLEQATD
jgi:hypothetical protein